MPHHRLPGFCAFGLALLLAGWNVSSGLRAAPKADSLVAILAEELERNFTVLKEKADPPPYFLSYEVSDNEAAAVSAASGALTAASRNRTRNLDVSVRVGTRKLDNYHRAGGELVDFTAGSPISLDDEPAAIKRRLWLDTDRTYRLAAERLVKIRTNSQVKVDEEDNSADFSEEVPVQASEPLPSLRFDMPKWSARLRNLSTRFGGHTDILSSQVTVVAQTDSSFLVTSEGTRVQQGRGYARIVINATGRAADGMDLHTSATFEAVTADGLPDDRTIEEAIDRVAKDLTGLLKAPVVEPFVGPAILSGRAAGVFFHEIFGHRIEGHRQKDENEGQTFTKKVGEPVLPSFLSVIFDPTQRKAGSIDLFGWYSFDEEGVSARRVPVVEEGILRTFLLSRSPIRGFDHSNGHGRRQVGREVVSRQSNLFVQSARRVPEAKLRQILIEEVKRQGKPYGLYFDQVTGGFTTTGRGGMQAFKVLPVVVYRIYPDGRPDELVRGADIVGTPLASFAKIMATSDQEAVFNGYCGAESGSVPVSAISPALLVSEIEVEKTQKSQERPPLLPPPSAGGSR